MWTDEAEQPGAQPYGFAQPEVSPIEPYATTSLTVPMDVPAGVPQSFKVDADPGPKLDQVAPAPPETRDPRLPFKSGQEDQLPGQRVRDPLQPIVAESFSGNGPDFAPPTGQPVVPGDQWAPPTGQPVVWGSRAPAHTVSGIARPASMAPWGPPSPVGSPPPPAGYPPSPVGNPSLPAGYPVQGVAAYPLGAPAPTHTKPMTEEQRVRAQYWAADGPGRFGVVMKAVPWPVLLVLLAGVVAGSGWTSLAFFVAWIVTGSNAKVAKVALNRLYSIVAVIFFVAWVMAMFAARVGWVYSSGNAPWTILRW